ncbi:MAG TPA: molecular chaperone TorD family protein [Gaiellaceae bacterium]|nr:molecular chaperone TorD family protein [Gaiellaceae bacterium]
MTTAVSSGVERAAVWRLLSLGFAPPREEALAEVEALAEALVGGADGHAADVLEAVRSESLDGCAAAYHRLFGGTVLVAPYEGSYELDPIRQGREMADVAAFYRAFGAEAHGPAAERPDHVGCELEFLAFLELRRLRAIDEDDQDGVELLEGIAASFLCDHPGRWLPTFFAAVHEAAEHAPVYRTLAALGARTVADELERRGLEPTPLPHRHERVAVERDAFECG